MATTCVKPHYTIKRQRRARAERLAATSRRDAVTFTLATTLITKHLLLDKACAEEVEDNSEADMEAVIQSYKNVKLNFRYVVFLIISSFIPSAI